MAKADKEFRVVTTPTYDYGYKKQVGSETIRSIKAKNIDIAIEEAIDYFRGVENAAGAKVCCVKITAGESRYIQIGDDLNLTKVQGLPVFVNYTYGDNSCCK